MFVANESFKQLAASKVATTIIIIATYVNVCVFRIKTTLSKIYLYK